VENGTGTSCRCSQSPAQRDGNNVKTFTGNWLKTRPESGLDWLIVFQIARQNTAGPHSDFKVDESSHKSVSWYRRNIVAHGNGSREREFFIDDLLVRIHFIIVMIRWTGLAPWEFGFQWIELPTFGMFRGKDSQNDSLRCKFAMRRAAHPSGCARCGAGAGCSATIFQSLLACVPWRVCPRSMVDSTPESQVD